MQDDRRCLRKFLACRKVAPQSGQTPGQSDAPRILEEPEAMADAEDIDADPEPCVPMGIGMLGGKLTFMEPGNDGICNGEYGCIGIRV